jgi:alpha-glucosidase
LLFIARLRKLLDQYGAMAVGEIEDEEPLKVQRDYTDGPERLHTAYSFYLLRQRAMTPAVVREAMQGWQGAAGWPSWSLSNHDVIRFPTRLAGDDLQRTKLMMLLLLTLRGTPFIYQGDELGLPHAEVPFERLRDPEAIAFWPNGIGRDGARTPMPWRRDANMAGFTDAPDAWLPLDPRHRALAADVQEIDRASMLNFTRGALAFRKTSAALRVGDFVTREAAEPLLAFERVDGDERVLCIFNLGDAPATYDAVGAKLQLFSVGGAKMDGSTAELPAYSALIAAL